MMHHFLCGVIVIITFEQDNAISLSKNDMLFEHMRQFQTHKMYEFMAFQVHHIF